MPLAPVDRILPGWTTDLREIGAGCCCEGSQQSELVGAGRADGRSVDDQLVAGCAADVEGVVFEQKVTDGRVPEFFGLVGFSSDVVPTPQFTELGACGVRLENESTHVVCRIRVTESEPKVRDTGGGCAVPVGEETASEGVEEDHPRNVVDAFESAVQGSSEIVVCKNIQLAVDDERRGMRPGCKQLPE